METQLKRYEKRLRFSDYRDSTIKTYLRVLKDFFIYLQKTYFTTEDIEIYLDKLQHRDISKQAWNQAMYGIRAYVLQCTSIKFPDFLRKKQPSNYIKPVPFKEDIFEAIKLKETLQEKAMLLILYDGFLRKSELWTLQEKDVLYKQNQIIVRDGKGNKQRIVEISPSTTWMIYYAQKTRKVYNPYICGKQDFKIKYLSQSVIYDLVHSAGLSVGYNNWYPHLMRHAGATHTFLETGDLLRVSRKLGHSKIETTLRYLNLHTEDLLLRNNPRYLPLIRKENNKIIEEKGR